MSTFQSLREAAKYADVSYFTIREWARLYGIGELVDGRWHIDKDRLDGFIAARQQFADAKAELRKSA